MTAVIAVRNYPKIIIKRDLVPPNVDSMATALIGSWCIFIDIVVDSDLCFFSIFSQLCGIFFFVH